jgi:hypothetical protein
MQRWPLLHHPPLQFLEAVLGHREERPLPPPPAAAAALRAKGLELLGRWEAQYGRRYRQASNRDPGQGREGCLAAGMQMPATCQAHT